MVSVDTMASGNRRRNELMVLVQRPVTALQLQRQKTVLMGWLSTDNNSKTRRVSGSFVSCALGPWQDQCPTFGSIKP